MTIEHAPSTNGRVHTDDATPPERRGLDAPAEAEAREASAISKFVMPLLLMAVALFVLRRLNKGNVV